MNTTCITQFQYSSISTPAANPNIVLTTSTQECFTATSSPEIVIGYFWLNIAELIIIVIGIYCLAKWISK